MKVLFIETPPSMDWTPKSTFTSGGRRHPALTVTGEMTYNYWNLTAAAVLRDNGHDAHYIHAQSEGLSVESVKKRMAILSPDLVVMCIDHIKAKVDFEIARYAHELNAKVVFVGPFVTALGKKLFDECKDFDIMATREYDYTILDIANAIEKRQPLSSVKGIMYRYNDVVKKTEERGFIQDLDALPIPAYDLIDINKFFEIVFLRMPTATTVSSRGCPFQCVFCTFPNTIYSHQWRAQSPKRVFDEAKYLIDEHKVKEIRYDDDTFEVDAKRVYEICDMFKKEKLDLTWQPQSRPDLMTDELCKRMAKAGCVKILYGVESGDDEVLKKIKKGMTTQIIKDGVMKARKYGIYLHNCFMVGFLWDTMETIKKTFRFAYELNGEFTQFAIATPLPGAPYYDLLESKGYLISDMYHRDSFHAAGVSFPHLDKNEIERLAKEAYSKFYTRPAYMALMARNAMRSPDHFKHFMRMVNAYRARKKEGWI